MPVDFKIRDRAPDQTQISISLSKGLLKRVDAAARADNRNRSNYICTLLQEQVPELAKKKKKSKKG